MASETKGSTRETGGLDGAVYEVMRGPVCCSEACEAEVALDAGDPAEVAT